MSDELKSILLCMLVIPLALLLKKFFDSSSKGRSDDENKKNGSDEAEIQENIVA